MRLLAIFSLLLLAGCTIGVRYNEEPYIIKGPSDEDLYLQSYTHKEIFYGQEASVAFPFLEPIPVVGSFLSGKLIALRAGAVRPIFIPTYREKEYVTQPTGGACPPVLHTPFGVQFDELQGDRVGRR